MKTLIENVRIITEEEILFDSALVVEDEKIHQIDRLSNIDLSKIDRKIDGDGLYLSPGFIDIHNHGNMGRDFIDASKESLDIISDFHLSQGVTSFLGTVITSSYELMKKSVFNIANSKNKEILGIYLEGPFYSFEKKGAQPKEYIKDIDYRFIKEIYELGQGKLRVVSLAPELDGSNKLIEYLTSMGVKVAMGHTMASYSQTISAIDKGASIVTHLYNGMLGFNHREPGILGAVLLDDRVYCEIIYDRVHVHDAAFSMAFKLKGADRLVLISDAMMAAGMGDGSYKLGGQDIEVLKGQARLANGSLAGSTLTLNKAVYNVVNFLGISLVDGIKMASLTPAKAIGVEDYKGSIEVGKDADLIFIDDKIEIYKVMVRGRLYE